MTRQCVRTWAAYAQAENSRFSSYRDRLPSTSCLSSRHSFRCFWSAQPASTGLRPASRDARDGQLLDVAHPAEACELRGQLQVLNEALMFAIRPS
jgi:hypothetical protein